MNSSSCMFHQVARGVEILLGTQVQVQMSACQERGVNEPYNVTVCFMPFSGAEGRKFSVQECFDVQHNVFAMLTSTASENIDVHSKGLLNVITANIIADKKKEIKSDGYVSHTTAQKTVYESVPSIKTKNPVLFGQGRAVGPASAAAAGAAGGGVKDRNKGNLQDAAAVVDYAANVASEMRARVNAQSECRVALESVSVDLIKAALQIPGGMSYRYKNG